MQALKEFHIFGQHYEAGTQTAFFEYGFDDDVTFTEQVSSPVISNLSNRDREALLFHIGIALGVSYYKLYPTKTIHVHNGKLNEKQKNFWQQFYIQGLGEFFYTNQLDPHDLANLVTTGKHIPPINVSPKDGYLVPIGGGKDSNVTISLLKDAGLTDQITLFTHGKDYELHKNITKVAGLPRVVSKKKIDPLLFEMNKQGYYNGHVPITGMISFVSLLIAASLNKKYIVFSNERSANYGNTTWKGVEINHQRSKSFAFEQAFAAYVHEYISPNTHYFSLLRPRHELRIAKEMSTLKEYFSEFSSCNKNFRLSGAGPKLRCGNCPKCHFTYLIMRPFLSSHEVEQIRGKEYYANEELLESFQSLRGVEGIKPFECVGTYEESQVATRLASQDSTLADLPAVKRFNEHVAPSKTNKERKQLRDKLLTTEQTGLTNIPDQLQKLLTK